MPSPNQSFFSNSLAGRPGAASRGAGAFCLCIILISILLPACKSSPRIRSSSLQIQILDIVDICWNYSSMPSDTTQIQLPSKITANNDNNDNP